MTEGKPIERNWMHFKDFMPNEPKYRCFFLNVILKETLHNVVILFGRCNGCLIASITRLCRVKMIGRYFMIRH